MNCRTHAKWLVTCLIVVLLVGCESASTRQKTTVGGAAAGGLIGGIVGHQSGRVEIAVRPVEATSGREP